MTALNETIAKRIAKLVRMMSSDFDGEVLSANARLKSLLKEERLTFHDLATVIENCNGEIEERKYSDSDAELIFAKGVEKGRKEEANRKDLPPAFYDADGQPRWSAVALFCQQHHRRLRPKEQEFIDDMAGKMMWREPTEKQGKWLHSIFIRLGGRRNQE